MLSEDRHLPIGARAFDLLSVLLENRDRVMSKSELLEQVWPGVVVEENNLTVQVSALRKLLGDLSISTVPGRGYRWALPVEDSESPPAPPPRPKPSLAVLPFTNLGRDDEQEYFADGLAEDISASLSRSPWIFVIAYGSSLKYRGSGLTLQQVCRELGVAYVVRGTVRRAGARLRVAAELVQGETGESAWSERYERPVDDLFVVQDEICARIVGTLEPIFLKREEQRAANVPQRDLLHWDLLMRARWHYWRSSPRHNEEAKRLLEQAMTLRPNDVAGLALLAFSLLTDVWTGWTDDPKGVIDKAYRLSTRAVALDPDDSFAHFAMGVALACMGQMERAIGEQRRALELYPHFAASAGELGRLLAFSGETREAASMVQQAMAASPSDPRLSLWLFTLGIAEFIDGNHREAVSHAASAVTQRPDWFFQHYLMAASLSELGELDAARAALTEAVRLSSRLTAATLRVGHPFLHDSHFERYVQALRRIGWAG